MKMRLQRMRVPRETQNHDLNMMKEETYNDYKYKNVRDPSLIKKMKEKRAKEFMQSTFTN